MTLYQEPFGTESQPIEANRYRLIQAAVCPYAHRPVIARELLGLDETISLGTTSSIRSEQGWEFSLDKGNVDPVLNIRYVQDIYKKSDPNHKSGGAVPILVDIDSGKIVRKESLDILRDFSTTFAPFHIDNAPNLYPEELQEDIDTLNKKIDNEIVSGIFQIGFAKSQQSYEILIENYSQALDYINKRLAKSRYLHGTQLTESDIVLFTSLVRFDVVYYYLFQANQQRLQDYPHLWDYMRDLYQMPAFRNTTDFEAIKAGYYMNEKLNPRGIVSVGPDVAHWDGPHNRHDL